MLGIEIGLPILIIGAITGLVYALLAAGLVLVYRSTGVINFAYGEVGALCAAILAKLVLSYHWPFALALLTVIALGCLLGGVIELVVVRRLQNAPKLVLLVATIGVGQLCFLAQLLLPLRTGDSRYPSPFHREVQVDQLLLSGKHFFVLAVVPAVIAVLALFLTRTPYGISLRAAAENRDAAVLAGISAKRISTVVWVMSGGLAALTVVMLNPVRGVIAGIPQEALGPGLLLRALAAALVGGLVSLPLALAGGLGIGVVEALLVANADNKGAADFVLFLLVLGLLILRSKRGAGDSTGFVPTPRPTPVPEALRDVAWVQRLPLLMRCLGIGVAVLLPFVFSGSDQVFLMSKVLVMAIAAVSITVLIGWAGQLSLGHYAFVGLGSMVTGSLVARGLPFFWAVGYSIVAGIFMGLIVGAPALRLKGLFLAITTLAFAIAASSWFFPMRFLRGSGSALTVPRESVLGISLVPQRHYYFLCLALLVVVSVAVSRLRHTGIGRAIVAVRDNEDRAASLSLSPAAVKLIAFAFSAGIAALAGGLLAGLRVNFGAGSFGPAQSLQLVAIAIIGGLGSIPGAILGTLYVVGLPALIGDQPEVTIMTSSVGLLVLLLYVPGGLMSVVYRVRAAALTQLAKGREVLDVTLPVQRGRVTLAVRSEERTPPALRAEGIAVDLGGRRILDGVCVEARPGETVGLIGANGAGKSTLMAVLSGFLKPAEGSVTLDGLDLTSATAHRRARMGMGRIFQDARLFADLTVEQAVKVALEARERSEFLPSLLALPPSRYAERRKSSEAAEIVSFLGLGRYAHTEIGRLSTGSRRIVELSCLIAQDARILLLDEPTAGVAQREAEAFAPLVKSIQKELSATVVIIEHDIPLVSQMSDRMYCLALGQVIAEGTPDEVRNNPAVVAAYLGTDERAISRSGALAKPAKQGGPPRPPAKRRTTIKAVEV